MRRLSVTELSLLEAFFTSLVVGLAETYFPAFSLLKGASPIQAGVLISLPMIFAVLFQGALVRRFQDLNLSTWVPLAAGVQLVALVGLTALATFELAWPVTFLFIFYSVYWMGFYAAIPAWNKWISDLVSVEDSQKYFASRTRFTQIGIVAGLVLGGVLLQLHQVDLPAEYLFAGLFSVCAVFKFITYKLFRSHTQSITTIHYDKKKAFALFKKYQSFFMNYSLFNLAIYCSAPFVASFLLTEKSLSYVHFMWVMVGLFSGKILFTLILSKTKKIIKPEKLLFWGAVVAAPLPILWFVCTNVPSMVALHFVSGMALASLEVGVSLSFFKNVSSDQKIEIISVYYFFNVLTQVLGALIGAFLLRYVVQESYLALFAIAGVVRFFFAVRLKNKIALS